MILSPMNVELTKVHYYESFRKHRNRDCNPHTCETIDNKINIYIKRNCFGQKSWTFNVNSDNGKNTKAKRNLKVTPVILTVCVVIAFVMSATVCAIIWSRHTKPTIPNLITSHKKNNRFFVFDKEEINVEKVLRNHRLKENISRLEQENVTVCKCQVNEVCLRQKDGVPRCFLEKDARDPSGCSGWCALNTEHCRLLDKRRKVYECVENSGGLQCPLEYFNCENKFCLHIGNKCNGIVDCGDFSDELNCPCDLTNNFQCGKNASCFENWKRCDGKPDCWDNSDENNCPILNVCELGSFACTNSTGCYLSSQFCDGVIDCIDESDEICS